MKSPVLLLSFNRPELTERVVQTLRTYQPNRLYFAVDGPRSHVPSDESRVKATKELLKLVDWQCDVQTRFPVTNLGCSKAVSEAIRWFFDAEEEGIILEDDCLPNESFFPYCNELLQKYRYDNRVMMISGESYANRETNNSGFSYSFSRYALIWGWASWRRAWDLYERDLPNWPQDAENQWPEFFFRIPEVAEYWRTQFTRVLNDPNYTWDYQWIYSCLTNSGLCIVPQNNLITNIGCGPNATHTHNEDWHLANRKAENLSFPLRHPNKVKIDVQLDYRIELDRFEIFASTSNSTTKLPELSVPQSSKYQSIPAKTVNVLKRKLGRLMQIVSRRTKIKS